MFNCACVYEFREVRIRGARCFYFVGALLFRDNVQTHLGGASIREGAYNRDITVLGLSGCMGSAIEGHVTPYRTQILNINEKIQT